jgi:predicted Zn-dependent peptidase
MAVGYHIPRRGTPEFWAMHIISQILLEGRDSWMYESVVQRGLADAVYGGISAQHGTVYTTAGENLWSAFVFHGAERSRDSLLVAMDVAVNRLRAGPVDGPTLQRAVAKALANFYGEWSIGFGEGRLDMLGQFALFDDDPDRINRFADEMRAITPALVHATAREYLRPTNRTILYLNTRTSR